LCVVTDVYLTLMHRSRKTDEAFHWTGMKELVIKIQFIIKKKFHLNFVALHNILCTNERWDAKMFLLRIGRRCNAAVIENMVTGSIRTLNHDLVYLDWGIKSCSTYNPGINLMSDYMVYLLTHYFNRNYIFNQ